MMMKKGILLLTLAFIATMNLCAQNDIFFLRYCQPDYVIMTSIDEEDPEYSQKAMIEFAYVGNTVIMKYYYEDGGEWILDEGDIMEQTFNEEMLVTEETHYEQRGVSEFDYGYQFDYSYDYDDQERVTGYTFDYSEIGSDQIWQSDALSTITYNDKGLRESAIIYYLDTEDEEVYGYVAEYTYDDAGKIFEEKRPYDEDEGYYEAYRYRYGEDGLINKLELYFGYDSEEELFLVADFYYHPTSLPEVQASDARVYAADGTLFINSDQREEVSVYSVTGTKLCSIQKEAGSISIPLSSYPNQVLIVKGKNWTRKTVNSEQ